MQFVIANTFQDSLARLSGDEQKAAKMAAFDLQVSFQDVKILEVSKRMHLSEKVVRNFHDWSPPQ
jgi:hypothetical protein